MIDGGRKKRKRDVFRTKDLLSSYVSGETELKRLKSFVYIKCTRFFESFFLFIKVLYGP